MAGSSHKFGGRWTEQKLDILQKYLSAYTKALSNKQFETAYIDAFAGTGYRESRAGSKRKGLDELLPIRHLLDGSARVALGCEPSFDKYVFIEKHSARCQELEKLKSEFPDKAKKISIVLADANDHLQTICGKSWKRHRAVLFLDPYGMEVRWQTIEAIAKTKAIDLWVLFPLGGVNRMLTVREGSSQVATSAQRMFEEQIEQVVKVATQVVSNYFLTRLRGCFAGVASNPAILYNSKNSPLYLFCFAAGNPRGASIALRIASHILKMGS